MTESESLTHAEKAILYSKNEHLYNQKKHGLAQICLTLGISKPILYAIVRESNGLRP